MKNKKVILSSILSLLLCLSLITGGTVALFTSTAETDIAITSSNVELIATVDQTTVQTKQLNGDWEDGADHTYGKGIVLSDDSVTLNNIVPGDGIKFDIAIKNTSTVDVQYRVKIAVNDDGGLFEGLTIKVDGQPISVSGSVSDWTLLQQGTDLTNVSVEIELEDKEDQNQFRNKNCTLSYIVEAVQGNAANHISIGNTKYETLADAMEAANVGDIIVLASGKYEIAENETTMGSLEIQEGADVMLILNENKVSSTVSKEINTPTVVNNGTLTIEGGTISNKNATAGNTHVAAVYNAGGTLTLKDCKIENTAPTSQGDYAVVVEGGKVILENCTVTGARGGIVLSNDASIDMIGGSVTASVYYPLYLSGSVTASFTNVSFVQNGSKVRAILYNTLEEGTGSVTFTNCSFKSTKAAPFSVSNTLTGVVFEGANTFTNVTDPTA